MSTREHTPIGGTTMLFIGGSSQATRCDCGTNVFTRQEDQGSEHVYKCNGCGALYAARDSR